MLFSVFIWWKTQSASWASGSFVSHKDGKHFAARARGYVLLLLPFKNINYKSQVLHLCVCVYSTCLLTEEWGQADIATS